MYCESYCVHGGVCELDAGHKGEHDSHYCQWTDADAISKADADARFRDMAREVGLPDEFTDLIADNT